MIKKKLKLDFYTQHGAILELQPIQPRSKPPTWWKSIQNSYDTFRSKVGLKIPTPTLKTCPGVVDYIRKPITLRLWSDAIFKVKPDGDVECIEPHYGAKIIEGAMHERKQFGDTLYPNRTIFKLHGPWTVTANRRAEFMITEVHFSEDLRKHNILLVPGITNFYDQHTLNVFLVFPIKNEEYTVTLKYGTPIMSIYPMHEQELDINMHKCTPHEFQEHQNMFPSTFIGRYHAGKHARNK